MRRKSKVINPNAPYRHPDHPRPTTRRQFLAQGFLTGGATVVAPTLAGMLAYPKAALATLAGDMPVSGCGLSNGAGKVPFIVFDLAGGANIAGSNVLVGGPGGQLDLLSIAGYTKLGLPGTMAPTTSGSGTTFDQSFGLRYHIASAQLKGIKTRVKTAAAMTNTTGTIIPALSNNDTNVNPHNPIYGIWQYITSGGTTSGGGLLDLIGTEASLSGGNSVAPPTMMVAKAAPVVITSAADTKGLVNTGQMSTLLPSASDRVAVLESMKRISDAKRNMVVAYPTAVNTSGQNANALGDTGTLACAYTKSAFDVDNYGDPSSLDPSADQNIVGGSGIFSSAEFNASSDYQKTAAVMKLVVNGYAAAGTIELEGFDYHTGDRATGEAKDLNAGNCIGAVLEYAARVGKPVMIYVISDGSLASNGMIDNSAGGGGKCVWTADNQNTAATYWLIFDPKGKPQPYGGKTVEQSLQIGYFNSDGGLNTTGSEGANNVFNLAQIAVLNYMALHGDQGRFANLYTPTNPNDTLSNPDAATAYGTLPSVVNGKIT